MHLKTRQIVRWFALLALIIGLVDMVFIWFIHEETVRTELLRKAREDRSAMSSATTINLRSMAASMQLQAMLLARDNRIESLLWQAGPLVGEGEATADGAARAASARRALYTTVFQDWEWIKAHSSARYLHFHSLPGPRSLLRMYDPERFGDEGLHFAVNLAVETGQPATAFETGRVYSGIRGAAPVMIDTGGRQEMVGVVEVGAPFQTLVGNLRQAFIEFGTDMQFAVLLQRSHLDRTLWPERLKDRQTLRIGTDQYVIETSTSDMIKRLAGSPVLGALKASLPGVEVLDIDRVPHEIMAFGIPMQERALQGEMRTGQAPACILVAWYPMGSATALEAQSLRRSLISGLVAYVCIMAAVGVIWFLGSRRLRQLVQRRTAELALANTELARAERSYRGIYESAVQGMFQSSMDGRYFSVNPAFVRMLGYDFPGEIGRIPNPAMHMFLGSEGGTQLMESLMHQGNIQNLETELERKDGSFIHVLGNAWINQDESGTSYIEGIVIDETGRKQAEEEALEKQRRLDEDLKTAAQVQLSLLPGDVPESECFHAEWRFMPSSQVSGDIMNIFELDCEHLAFYVLDVSGHGVASSLVGASASQALQPYSYFCSWSPEGPGSTKCNHPPKVVLELLNMEFPFERFDRFLTICYLVLNLRTGTLSYCNAGHPEPCLLRTTGEVEVLPLKNTIIGMDRSLSFEQGRVQLSPGDKVFIYTDGVVDYRSGGDEFYGEERLMRYLSRHQGKGSAEILDGLNAELMAFGDNLAPRDDITLLSVEFLKGFPGQNSLGRIGK